MSTIFTSGARKGLLYRDQWQAEHPDATGPNPHALYQAYQQIHQEANGMGLRLERESGRLSRAEHQLLTRLLDDLRCEAEHRRHLWLESVHGKAR